jgi:hypothetical protein
VAATPRAGTLGRQGGVTPGLNRSKLLHDEFEPVHLAQNLGRKLGRQGRTLRRAHLRQPRSPVAQGRLEAEHALWRAAP